MSEYIKKEDAIEAVTSLFRVSALFSGMSDDEKEWREKAEKVLSKCEVVTDTAVTPQTKVRYCNECKWFKNKQVCGRCRSKNLFAEADTPQTERAETMSCQECKWWFTDSLKHGGYCQSLLYNHECRYEPEVDCSWK